MMKAIASFFSSIGLRTTDGTHLWERPLDELVAQALNQVVEGWIASILPPHRNAVDYSQIQTWRGLR